MSVPRVISLALASLALAGTAAHAQNRGEWPMQSLSPLGTWRGHLRCGGYAWPVQVEVRWSAEHGADAEVAFDPGAEDPRRVFTRYWAPYARYSAEVDFRYPVLRLTPGRWLGAASREAMMPMELRLAPGGRLEGRAAGNRCSDAELERWNFAVSAEEMAERRRSRGVGGVLPLRVLAAHGGIAAFWRHASACTPPAAAVEVSAENPRLLLPSSPTFQRFAELLEEGVSLECPGARTLDVAFAADTRRWAMGERQGWAAPPGSGGMPASPAPPASAVGPTRLPPVASLPAEGRAAAARARWLAAAREYRAAMAPILAAHGSVSGNGISPFQLAGTAARICSYRPATIPAETNGRICYFAGMATAGLIGTAEFGGIDASGDGRLAASRFVQCAERARLRECALLAEYLGVVMNDNAWIETARRQLPTATRAISSPEAVVREILPTLIAARRAEMRGTQ